MLWFLFWVDISCIFFVVEISVHHSQNLQFRNQSQEFLLFIGDNQSASSRFCHYFDGLIDGRFFRDDRWIRIHYIFDGNFFGFDIFLMDKCFYDLSIGKDRKSTRLNSSQVAISYTVFCLKKKTQLVMVMDKKLKNDER